ncbi:MAG TPA: tetratricopeptide repeat protein [Longimicrobiales bacterium]|nr:tetratricopeptide repeat protein [Longimicrobiales bacterium]
MSMSPGGSRGPTGLLPSLLLCAVSAACATTSAVRAPSPDEIPALEARVEASPRDGEGLILLGAAYREAGRLDEARETLEEATQVAPGSADAVFFLGLTYEDMGSYEAAGGLYRRYLQLNPTGAMADEIRDRVALVRRMEVQQAVRAAVEREQELADTPPNPATIAVFPFPFEGGSSDLEPLGMALSGMIATDLAQSSRLTVLERSQLQALMDEIALGRTGLVDQQTAARSGRILGAGRIVQGRVAGDEAQLSLDAAVIEVGPQDAQAASVEAQDALDRLFDLEKQLVLGIFDAMGVTLTPAERERVTQRRTENLEALLAYGRGIDASYRGSNAEAARHFSEAARIDPGFTDAAVEAQESESVASASSTGTAELAQQSTDVAADVDLIQQDALEAVERAADWNPRRDSPVVGEGALPTITSVRIIIRRPSGGGR